MKTLLFTVLLLGWDFRNQQMFHSKIIKNHACKPNIFMMLQMTENIQKVIKNPVQRGTQNPSKIMKKSTLGPSKVPPCASATHFIAKWYQNGAQGTSNDPKIVIWGP